jgi:hypothetical protein
VQNIAHEKIPSQPLLAGWRSGAAGRMENSEIRLNVFDYKESGSLRVRD